MASVKSLFKLFSTCVTRENADHLWSLWINPVTYLIPHSIMHGDDSWRENKNTHGLWNKHPFNPFKQAAMSLCHDSSHNNLHRHYPGSVAMASAPSVVATFEGGSLGCFIPREKFPRCRWQDGSWKRRTKLKIIIVPDFRLLHTQFWCLCKEYPLGFTIHHPELIMLKKIKKS